jgi:uncharacterized protein Smg (DUF494 family)
MADELEKPNFGIIDTIEMGAGNTEILNDLFAPETSTGNPDEVTPIIKEASPIIPAKKPDVPKGKEIVQVEEGETPAAQNVISNFLGDNTIEEETQEEIVKPEVPVDETPEEVPVSTFTTLSKDLLKLGVFTTEEGEEEAEITTPQEFLDRFKSEKQKGAIEVVNNFIGQFGEDYQNAFEAIFVKGVPPKEYFGIYNTIVDFANLDMSVEDNQIAVIRQGLTDQGFETEDIATEIERLKNYGDLEPVATKHHKVLVKKQTITLQQKEKQAEQDLKQRADIKNQYIQNVQTILQDKLKTKEFDGIPINSKLAAELQDFLLVDKWKTPSGELLSDFDRTILDMKKPENHGTKVKIALLLKILEKDPTLSTIQRTAISKQTDELFTNVARQVTKTKMSIPNSQPKSWFQQ